MAFHSQVNMRCTASATKMGNLSRTPRQAFSAKPTRNFQILLARIDTVVSTFTSTTTRYGYRISRAFGRLGSDRKLLTPFQTNPDQVAYAQALWERIRRECKLSIPFPSNPIYAHSIPDQNINSPNSPGTANLPILRPARGPSPRRHV